MPRTTIESPQDRDACLRQVRKFAVYVEPTGSRYICDPAPMDTDEDYVVLCSNKGRAEILRLMDTWKFDIGGSRPASASDDSAFKSFKKGDLNFIITTDIEFFGRFVAATTVAKRLNLLAKADRVALFRAVLYGRSA